MYFKNDWIMQQIEAMVQFIARIIFHKDAEIYEVEDETALTDADLLYIEMKVKLRKKDICGAENLLFDRLTAGDKNQLRVALSFYGSLNKMTDEELEAQDFSREEIQDGLREIVKLFGVVIPEL